MKNAFLRDPNDANPLISYESVPRTITAEGNAGLWVVVPAEWMLGNPEHFTDTFPSPVTGR